MTVISLGEKMKNLIFVVLLVIAGIAGYDYINKPVDIVDSEKEAVTAVVEKNSVKETVAVDEVVTPESESSVNLMTPADMSEEAQAEMYSFMMEYNKCMMQNKPEYHQLDVRTEDIAAKTFDECAPNLDDLKAVLAANGVNEGLQEGMVKTLQQRASRKLMSAIMQSKAAKMSAGTAAIPAPEMPVTP